MENNDQALDFRAQFLPNTQLSFPQTLAAAFGSRLEDQAATQWSKHGDVWDMKQHNYLMDNSQYYFPKQIQGNVCDVCFCFVYSKKLQLCEAVRVFYNYFETYSQKVNQCAKKWAGNGRNRIGLITHILHARIFYQCDCVNLNLEIKVQINML